MSRYIGNPSHRFAIRKYKVGVASVLVCSAILLGAQAASADEVTVAQQLPTELSVVAGTEELAQLLPQTPPSLEKVTPTNTEATAVGDTASAEASTTVEAKAAEAMVDSGKTNLVETDKPVVPVREQASSDLATLAVEVGKTEGKETPTSNNLNGVEAEAGTPTLTDKEKSVVAKGLKASDDYEKPRGSMDLPNGEVKTATEQVKPSDTMEKGPTSSTVSGLLRLAKYTTRSSSQTAFRNSTGTAPLAPSGTYHFTSTAGIKAEPKLSSPDLASYGAGQSVNYDRVLTADGYKWISYIAYSGNRRYIAIGKATAASSTTSKSNNATVEVTNYQQHKTNFTVKVTGNATTNAIKEVKVAVWSKDKGQDDLKWYTPAVYNNQASQTIDIANHSNTSDKYIVHVYTTYDNNKTVGSNLGEFQITKPTTSTPVPSTSYLTSPNARPLYQANTYPTGECTWGAKQAANWVNNWWGNAGTSWIANAQRDGFTLGDTPVVGAVVVWEGHVAVVTEVVNHNLIRVTESNVNNQRYLADHRGLFNPNVTYNGGVLKYIYPPTR